MLPVRGLSRGKSRLAGALDAAERMRLNRRLLRHTLWVLDRWLGGLGRCVVVSPCARTLQLARREGAVPRTQSLPRAGLNAALTQAIGSLVRAGARRVLILPCDLPLLSASSLTAFDARAAEGARVVIAPDRSGTGTNALLLEVPARFALCFGPASFVLHKEVAHARGWGVRVCECPELMFDLDTPQDLAAWEARGSRRWGR